jgi:hypothetical protein
VPCGRFGSRGGRSQHVADDDEARPIVRPCLHLVGLIARSIRPIAPGIGPSPDPLSDFQCIAASLL